MNWPMVTASLFLLFFLSHPVETFAQFGGASKPVTLTGTVYTETGNHTIMQAYVLLVRQRREQAARVNYSGLG